MTEPIEQYVGPNRRAFVTEGQITEAGLKRLRAPFPANQISKLPKPYKSDSPKGKCAECGGFHGLPAMHLDYVGHAALTDRLLDADPAWTWEPLALGPNGLPVLDASGGMWIRLTVHGVTRLGYGDAQGKAGGNAIKECIGDALRNAAMRFGAALDLWHKGELHVDEEPEKKPTEQAREFDRGQETGAEREPIDADGAITPEQVAIIEKRLAETGIKVEAFLAKAGGIDSIADLSASAYEPATGWIERQDLLNKGRANKTAEKEAVNKAVTKVAETAKTKALNAALTYRVVASDNAVLSAATKFTGTPSVEGVIVINDQDYRIKRIDFAGTPDQTVIVDAVQKGSE